jgi:hypothetical protein
MCALDSNFVDYGFTVFMDTVVQDRAMLDFLLALLSPRAARLVVLAPGIGTCRQRNLSRPAKEQFAFDGYEQLEADMQRGLGDASWWFDTSRLTPEATAERLVHDVVDEAAPLRGHWTSHLDRRPET